jgi:hypothetical protein
MRSAMKKKRRPVAAAIAVAALLPRMVGGAQAAAAVAADPAPPGGQGAGSAAVPLEGLVPGIPPSPHERHIDTPDQALPPVIPHGSFGHTRGPRDETSQQVLPPPRTSPQTQPPVTPQVTPPAASSTPSPTSPPDPPDSTADADATVEYVPPQDVQPSRTTAAPHPCTASTGPYQREVERFLKLTVDGKQSKKDCEAIRKWQIEENIQPAIGFAGPSSWGKIRLIKAQRDPNAAGRCPVVDARVACVDLPRQLMWVQAGEDVIFGPVPIRSGKAGYPTRVGWNRIYWKNKDHHSTIYDSPMPFAQFFNGGQAFHGVYGNIYDPTEGSYGCVNLRYDDAKELWDVLHEDDRVYSWGRRPGT